MTSENETIADIVREIRVENPRNDYPAEYGGGEVPNKMRGYADRIEAAHRCELSELKRELELTRQQRNRARLDVQENFVCEVAELKRKLEAKQAWIDAMTERSKKDASIRCAVLEQENKWLKSKMEWIVKKCDAVLTSSGKCGHSEVYGWQLARDILVYTGRKDKSDGKR